MRWKKSIKNQKINKIDQKIFLLPSVSCLQGTIQYKFKLKKIEEESKIHVETVYNHKLAIFNIYFKSPLCFPAKGDWRKRTWLL